MTTNSVQEEQPMIMSTCPVTSGNENDSQVLPDENDSQERIKWAVAFDGRSFVDALRKAGKAVAAFVEAFNAIGVAHHDRHHMRELPSRSALHAAYDHRRRARRARRQS